ncbi:MAG: DNA-directed RNA polymerase sigma-70 factor [Planctomycetota bacterium]|nr:MAG: DNA-directed RNA polymerase sigma-70 factor [Planctomycetota bacterium]
MTPARLEDITGLLQASPRMDPATSGQLVELLRDELHGLAASMMRRQPAGHTLQATALVNEMYLRLAASAQLSANSRAHFLGIAARAMRQVLARHAQDRRALKRGGAFARVSFVEDMQAHEDDASTLALDTALEKLAQLDERQARVIEMRFFADMTIPEIAECLDVSASTVEREWRMARAWVRAEMARDDAS